VSRPSFRSGLALCLTFASAGGCGSSGAPGASSSPPPSSSPSGPGAFAFKAANHVSWWHDGYAGAVGDDARSALVATRANWAGVLVTWYMEGRTTNTIAPDPLQTPTDDVLAGAIRDLHALGFKVMLKPHVDVKDGSWRGTIQPADPGLWFTSYDAFLSHFAVLAQANGVDLLDVGTELVTMSDARHESDWGAVIAHLRAAYSGPLTYGANANASGDEFVSVSFWSLLDYAGLDVYPPLTNHNDPTLAELTSAWSHNRYGDDIVAAYRNWQAGHGKPVLFTEIGYRSIAGTNQAPYDYARTGAVDAAEQADCYEAALAVWSGESSWVQGTFWWDWPVDPPGPNDTDYTPRGKPAESVLTKYYGR